MFFGVFFGLINISSAVVLILTRSVTRSAAHAVSAHAKVLCTIWEREKSTCTRTKHALQLLASEALETEDVLSTEQNWYMRHAWRMCGGYWLRCVFGLPQNGLPGSNGRVSLAGKVRQKASDIEVSVRLVLDQVY